MKIRVKKVLKKTPEFVIIIGRISIHYKKCGKMPKSFYFQEKEKDCDWKNRKLWNMFLNYYDYMKVWKIHIFTSFFMSFSTPNQEKLKIKILEWHRNIWHKPINWWQHGGEIMCYNKYNQDCRTFYFVGFD